MTSDPITQFLMALLALIFGSILWVILYRKPMVLVISTLLGFLLFVLRDQETIVFQFGQYVIGLSDVLSFFLITVALARSIFVKNHKSKWFMLVIFFGILLFTSWVRGILIFNIQSATNAFRTYFYFFAVFFYMCTLNYGDIASRKVLSIVGFTSIILITIAHVRWIMVDLGLLTSSNWTAPNGSMVRVLSAPATLFLLQVFFYILYSGNLSKKGFFKTISAILILCMLLFLQQRSIWVALAIASLFAVLLKSKMKNIIVLTLILVIILFMFFMVFYDFSIEDFVGTPLDLQNLNWRMSGWKSLLDPERFQSTLDYIIGQPFGTGYIRYIQDSINETAVSPHNFYLQTFLNIGIFGLATMLLVYGYIILSLWKSRMNKVSQFFFALLVCQLTFYLTYSPNFEQGIVLGIAFLYVQQKLEKPINPSQVPYYVQLT